MKQLKQILALVALMCPIVYGETSVTKCDIEILSSTTSNPVLREMEKIASTFKCTTALNSGHLTTAQKYWNEIICIESKPQPSDSTSPLAERLLPTLQHIIRDYCSLSSASKSFNTILEFIESTNTGPFGFEFLLNEMRSYDNELIYGRSIIFEVGSFIKHKFGTDSKIFTELPNAVQLILSGKAVLLKNNGTGNYLAFNEFQPKDKHAVINAVTVPKSDDMKNSSWEFETIIWGLSQNSYFNDDANFQQIKSIVSCTQPNCTQYLAVKIGKPPSRGSYNLHESKAKVSTTGDSDSDSDIEMAVVNDPKFSIQMVSNDMIYITRAGSYYAERNILGEIDNGTLEFAHYYTHHGGYGGYGHEVIDDKVGLYNLAWIVSAS